MTAFYLHAGICLPANRPRLVVFRGEVLAAALSGPHLRCAKLKRSERRQQQYTPKPKWFTVGTLILVER